MRQCIPRYQDLIHNEIANLCDRIGCDVHDVAMAMGMDNASANVSCSPAGFRRLLFSKDNTALASVAKHFGAARW